MAEVSEVDRMAVSAVGSAGRSPMSAVEGADTTAIRARLDELRENPAQFSRAFDLDAALRAVLDLSEMARRAGMTVDPKDIDDVIAEHIGVTP